MGMYFTTTEKTQKNSARLASDVDRFLASGGEINQIPRGQSAESLQVRSVKGDGHGTRVVYTDPKMKLTSKEAKDSSIRKMVAKKENERLRKAQKRGDEMRAKGKARREPHMPRIRQMLEEGKSRREIARAIGVAHGTVNYWMGLEGLTSGK